MKVRDVMTPHVEVVHPDATLQEAAAKMERLDVGPLPVCDGRKIQGMLTDRDITVRATAKGRDPKTTRVREVMTEEVFYCFDDQDVSEAAEIMERAQIRRLVVVNQDKDLVGIVALGDLAVQADQGGMAEEEVEDVLESVSRPSQPQR